MLESIKNPRGNDIIITDLGVYESRFKETISDLSLRENFHLAILA